MDVELVQMTPENILNLRSNKLYFKAYGQLCVHKCIARGLDFIHIVDYLNIGLTKVRTWETMSLTCQERPNLAPNPTPEQRQKNEIQLLLLTLKLSHLLALDDRFFQESTSQDQQEHQ